MNRRNRDHLTLQSRAHIVECLKSTLEIKNLLRSYTLNLRPDNIQIGNNPFKLHIRINNRKLLNTSSENSACNFSHSCRRICRNRMTAHPLICPNLWMLTDNVSCTDISNNTSIANHRKTIMFRSPDKTDNIAYIL